MFIPSVFSHNLKRKKNSFSIRFIFINFFFCFLLFQNTVDKLVQRANASLLIGTSSWKEQFLEAITVSAGKSVLFSINYLKGFCLYYIFME